MGIDILKVGKFCGVGTAKATKRCVAEFATWSWGCRQSFRDSLENLKAHKAVGLENCIPCESVSWLDRTVAAYRVRLQWASPRASPRKPGTRKMISPCYGV